MTVAIGLRLAFGAYFHSQLPVGQSFEFGDSDGYWVLGQTIAAGEPYEYRSPEARVFRMPGYPALLAPIFLIGGQNSSPIWGRILSALLGGLTAAIVIWWGTLLFDWRAGIVAGWITALYPGAVAMGSFVLSEAPFMPLMAAHLALATAAFRASTPVRSVTLSSMAGLAAVGAIYMRPSWLLFLPFAMLFGMLRNPKRWRVAQQFAIASAVVCICLLPWWMRNYRVTGHFVPTTLQVGASLYDGLNPNASGGSNMNFSLGDVLTYRQNHQFGDGAELDEYTLNQCYQGMAIDWARANPFRVVQLAGIKFSRMWNVVPNEPMFRSWFVKLGVAITFTPLFVLGLFGLLRFGRISWVYVLPALPSLYFTLLHVIFVSGIRYREPAMLGLIVLAAGVVTGWKQSDVPTITAVTT